METLIGSLIAIAAIDSINPNAMAVQIYLLTTQKPVARSVAFIVGEFLAAWIVGLLLTLGLARIIAQVFNYLNVAIYILQLILGIALVLLGCYFHKFASNSSTAKRPKSFKVVQTFWLGFIIAFSEAPTALPYLVAIEQIVRANLQFAQILVALAVYNFVFIFPLILLLGIYLFFHQNAASVLDRIHRSVNRWFPKIMRVVLIVLGVLLILDFIAYLFGRSILF